MPSRLIPAILLAITLPTLAADLADEIAAAETDLLPTTIIAGEAPFTLAKRMAHHGAPGLSIAVIQDFELRWVKHYGVADNATGDPVDDETLFCVGSMSKGVTATTVLSLVRDGLVDLDGDINGQLTGWQLPANEFTAQATVTPRLLLNHTGGVAFSPAADYDDAGFPTTLQNLRGQPPAQTAAVVVDRVPGTEFMYSNGGFTILELLVSERGGAPFVEVAASRVF